MVRENVVLLDGDILKKIVDENVGYTEIERRKRAMKYARICKMLTDQNIFVVCCTIAMYDEVREWNRKNNKRYVEVFLDVPEKILQRRNQKRIYSDYQKGNICNVSGMDLKVEFPKNPDVKIVNDGSKSVEMVVKEILNYTPAYQTDFDRDTEYWNAYYNLNKAPQNPSLFAEWVVKQLEKGKTLLELGCGNGRDSLFFYQNKMNVTAIDASSKVIEKLRSENKEDNIYFICDDFVCSTAIYAGQYDYCYSRFSLHAINEEQESEVINNVFKVLKTGGKFFIETRSVQDELYGKGEKVAEDSYYYNGHFRRFVRKEKLIQKLVSAGFEIDYSEEAKGFAPYYNVDPKVIRIVAKK